MAGRRRPRRDGSVDRRRPRAAPRTDGPVLELRVERIAHGGVAVAHHDGRVVFVADAVPGERVAARVTDATHDRYWRAETLDVLDASPDRREHVWAEASVARPPEQRAGGAEFGHIRMPRQRDLKAEVLRDALRRFGGVETDVAVEPVPIDAAPGVDVDAGTGWRTRVRLHVDADGVVGPYSARSHRVIPVASVPLADPRLQAVAPLGERRPGLRSIDLVAWGATGAELVEHRGDRDAHRSGGPAGRRPVVAERVGARVFEVDRDGFWQVHRGAAATLHAAVGDALDLDRVDPAAENHDLYGGVGLLAAAVADRVGDPSLRITTVEADARATEHAGANLADLVGARAVTERVDRYLDGVVAGASSADLDRWRRATVVLDPPRSGAGREVVERLAELRPAQLVYVACDPVALARDVGLLRAAGYELEHLRAFDLFPNTHHVEAVARLAAIV